MKRRAVIYARVSTEHEAQISALENQVQYYDEIMERHPEWELVDRYIDEGITGTSINKRQSFMRMLKDASLGKFELIITREVSRFARNTVDTLQQTRILKTYGVEVWFTEDNIWTMNDEDGELRLSIMATLAQNESKKISQRVKAGQMISFHNGKLYGNGNILGYDRVGDQLVVNQEQAATVKRIYGLYLAGDGVRKIHTIMEQEGRKTAMGLTKWSDGNITRILKNSFYCGRIEYRKQYVPDYLTQKKINNKGEIERVYIEGKHEKIISPEDFDKAQEIRLGRLTEIKTWHRGREEVKHLGQTPIKIIWTKKCFCTCGHRFNRRTAHKSKITGRESFIYQCYGQIHTGTPRYREKRGLSLEGICDNTTFMEWKLEIQADFIFKKLIRNKTAIYEEAIKMLADIADMKNEPTDNKDKIERNVKEIDKLKKKAAVLLDMCTEGDISREDFRQKKQKLDDQISKLEKTNNECRQQILESEDDTAKSQRLKALDEFVKMKATAYGKRVPDTIIDYYVDHIVHDKGVFHWYLSPELGNKELAIDASDLKKPTSEKTSRVCSSTGCYR